MLGSSEPSVGAKSGSVIGLYLDLSSPNSTGLITNVAGMSVDNAGSN